MAGVLIDHRLLDLFGRRTQADLRQVFGDVFYFADKFFGPSGKLGIVFEKVVVLLQVRSATGGVGYDGVVISTEKNFDVVSRQLARFFPEACMGVKRAATALTCGNVDLDAILNE